MTERYYTLLFDKQFVRDYRKLDNSLQMEGDKKLKRLKENPKEIGKPLKFFPNLYELHLRMYRIYYVIQEFEVKVLVLAVEHKDEQDKYLRNLSLEKIKRLLEENI
ncbi:MAG: type II toxin-antitoxin system RelE/ParE family toxin [Nanoarchaeota archaeon]